MRRVRARGFTLIELLTAVAVMAVLIAFTVPAYRTMVRKNNVVNASNGLLSMLTLARGEAARRNRYIVVCKTTSTTACSGASTWDQGALVYVDSNNNSSLDTGEEVVRVQVPVSTTVTVSTTSGTNFDIASSFKFQPDGSVCSSGGGCLESSFTLQSGSDCSRQLTINPMTGQIKVVFPSTSTACPNV